MFYNEYEMHQLAKLRKEETERKARDIWKLADVKKESFLQKVVKKWNNREKFRTVQPSGGCACPCG